MSATKIKKSKKPTAEGRLKELEKEYQKGIDSIKALDAQRNNVVQTVLRIEGAIQGMKSLIDPPPDDGKEGAPDGKQSK